MRLSHKLKKFIKSLKYWYLRREMVFFADGKMYKYCYVVAMKYFKLAKIIKRNGISNTEREIASIINSSTIAQILADKKLSFSSIEEICSENLVEIKAQRLIASTTKEDTSFITVDCKEANPFICYDDGTVKSDELDDIIRTIRKQIQFYVLEDFLKIGGKIEFLFPKINAFYFEKK